MSHDTPVVLVTGGSGGIGSAVAAVLVEKGYQVILTARNFERLEDMAIAISKDDQPKVVAIPSDAVDQQSIDQMVAQIVARFGHIDVLVNCAASTNAIPSDLSLLDVNVVASDLNTKVCGYLRYIRAVVPAMKQHRFGRIINIGGLTGRSSDAISGMRNVAVVHLTKTLSDILGQDGITVNALHPAIIQTPHLDELMEEMAEEADSTIAAVEADFIAKIPIRRIMTANELGEIIAFLSSNAAAAITGESIATDGGYSRGIYL
jgi:NAD(P)-dependent dehydrogenase (short-subunit alcohol dehydrogenase family)